MKAAVIVFPGSNCDRDLGSLTDAYTEVATRLGVMPKNATPITKPTLIN